MTELLFVLGFVLIAGVAMIGVIAEGIHASRRRAIEQLEALAARYREGLARMTQAFISIGVTAADAAEALKALSRVTGTITFDGAFEPQRDGFSERIRQRYSQTPLTRGDAARVVLAEDQAATALAEEVPDA